MSKSGLSILINWSSWDLGRMHPQTLLACGFNDSPLYAEHGAPLRVYSAVKLG